MLNLNTLLLADNAIEQLPENIGQLTRYIRAFNCRDSTNNLVFCSMTNLDVQGNLIYQLPQSISRMKDIKVLNISRNKIDLLPNWLGFLQHLEVKRTGREY